MIRETKEEANIDINKDQAKEIYSGTDYSRHGTHYTLFITKLGARPEVKLSWEHSLYKRTSLDEFLENAAQSRGSFMYMVRSVLK